jgi:hypothetical protein
MADIGLCPLMKLQLFDDDGTPLNGGKVYFFEPGTATPKDTYTTQAGDVANAHPVVLDARGEADVFLNGLYDVTVDRSDDTQVDTHDNVSMQPSTVTVLSEWWSKGDTPTYVSAASFTIPSDETADYQVGRRVKCAVTAGIVYGYIKVVAYTSLTTVTVVLDSGSLDSGLSTVDLGLMSVTDPSLPNLFSLVPSFTTTERDLFTPIAPMLIYNSTLSVYQIYIAAWHTLTADDLASTLAGKTLVTPTIASFANAPHGHADSAGGGLISNSLRDNSRNLIATNNASNPTFQVDIDADEVLLQNTSFAGFVARAVNLTVDITASGANGLDTGSEANSTWYYLWVIYNGTTVAGLLSTNSTTPDVTFDTSYTYKALIGAVYNGSGGDFVAFHQIDNKVACLFQAVLGNGSSTTWASVDLSSFLPSTAKLARMQYNADSPSTSVWGAEFASNSSGTLDRSVIMGRSDNLPGGSPFDLILAVASTMYYKETGAAGTVDIAIRGWEY